MPQSFFILSGEQPELAKDELVSISKSYDPKATSTKESRLVIIKSAVPWEKIAKRATFVRTGGSIVSTLDDILETKLHLSKPKTFACRVINLSSKKINKAKIESDAGTILKEKWGSNVSLSNPMVTVYFIITNNKKYLGYAETMREPKRPRKTIKYPTELDWKLARCMVNLSQLKEEKTICDPFCGTGTILLEAESMGIHSIGIDFDGKMCNIAEKNLVDNGYDSKVVNSTYHDIQKIKDKIDAVVTDVPYGVASRTSIPPKRVLQDFLSIVPKTMKLVIVYKKGLDVDELGKAKKYEIFRHKSLTRVIAVT
ncbi:MAG: methyltransferase domain-containing protein [Thaumarchaeota archaeon]|nr:methyltransferase domain-containing protein [Nitrososphaerota archaeon]MDE1867594.1 methyltransferase domain-containing protein [Nitrososphaerota archaeon]